MRESISVELSFEEIFEAAIVPTKAENDLDQMIVCVAHSSKVEKVWDLQTTY